MYEYQKTPHYFAQVAGELEADSAAELEELGARDVQSVRRGVAFSAERPLLYRICYSARLVGKILVPLLSFKCDGPESLYQQARRIDYRDFLDCTETFSIFANVRDARISHSQYAALRLKDAIVDQFRDRFGKRPSVDREAPLVRFALYLGRDRATISLEATGGSLHRRGYRMNLVRAPLQETLGSAIIRYTGWKGERPLTDPFCGSGTLLGEALMQYCRVPSGYLREQFGFERLPDFDRDLWRRERQTADAQIRPLPAGLLSGSDLDEASIRAARANLERLPYGEAVALRVADFRELSGFSNHVIVCNPPYGVRLGDAATVKELYRSLGDFFKERCAGSTAFVYVGAPDLIKALGLRPSARKTLVNGALEGRLVRFELFKGNWKAKLDG